MAAAVADYRPAEVAAQKIKKGEGELALALARTADILAQVAERRRAGQVIAGFAAETEDAGADGPLVENARRKLEGKGLDLIVANDARRAMGSDLNQVTLIERGGRVEALPLLTKEAVAEEVVGRVVGLLARVATQCVRTCHCEERASSASDEAISP
jgi:phosphopantothenoylcysteine decarboxylase/phosphopantothenate--cysteine ligase